MFRMGSQAERKKYYDVLDGLNDGTGHIRKRGRTLRIPYGTVQENDSPTASTAAATQEQHEHARSSKGIEKTRRHSTAAAKQINSSRLRIP